ncbi:MAG: hypothetical protein Q8O26_20155, partial [Phreatobacter sp.]|uniref:hypothetical protein n=1 Tax=Phreatobacter sp. TaxID=1966341 RepID=UPI0027354C5E
RGPLRRQSRHAVREIYGIANVLYASIGEKRVAGNRTGEPAIIAYVLNKGDTTGSRQVPRSMTIPNDEGAKSLTLKTDVVELASAPRAFGVRTGHIIQGFDGDIGVCGLVFNHNNKNYFLTNAHVVANVAWNANFGRVRLFDRVNQAFTDAGLPSYVSPLKPGQVAAADVAAIAIPDDLTADEMHILDFKMRIARFGPISQTPGLNYWYSVNGLLHECSFPEFVEVEALADVDGTQVRYTKFWQLQMTSGAAAPGQSGALLCRTAGNTIEACGLIFGGIAPTHVWAFPIRPMLSLAQGGL